MTAVFAMGAPDPAPEPRWLRPTALGLALALHAGVLVYGTLPRADITGAVDTIDISIEPAMGETTDEVTPDAPDTMAQQEVQAPVAPTPDVDKPDDQAMDDPPPPPVPEQVVAAEPPKVEEETAPVIQQKPPEDIQKPIEKPKPVVKRRPPPQAAAAQSAHRARAGQDNGRRASASARAAFAGRLLAAINRNKRAVAASGSVRIHFLVGAGGGMSVVSVIRSSGNGAMDSAAVRAVRSAHAGAPPGGAFPGMVTINFHVN